MNEEKWSKIFVGRNYPMAPERPRFVGEAVAMVVAESAALASEAAELVAVEYVPLPAVALTEDAVADGAPKYGMKSTAMSVSTRFSAIVRPPTGPSRRPVTSPK